MDATAKTQTAFVPDRDEPKANGKPLSQLVLGYLSCPQDPGRNYLGGILLTDWRTRPLEFAYVSPVKISLMQRIVHGKTLDEAVVVDVIGRRLIQESTKAPDVIFVDSDLLLNIQRILAIPVVKLARQSETVDQVTKISPLTYTTARPDRFEEQVGPLLSTLGATTDLLDPFLRLTEAIKEGLKAVAAQNKQ